MVLLLSLMDRPSFLMYCLFILYHGTKRCKFKYSSKWIHDCDQATCANNIYWWRRAFKMQKRLVLKSVNIWVHDYLKLPLQNDQWKLQENNMSK